MLKATALCKRKRALTAGLLLAALGMGSGLGPVLAQSRNDGADKGDKAADEKPAAGLSLDEFKELKPVLEIKSQPWTTIPWKYSITEARKQAAASKKPIFMVVNTGNSLGCT
jgi:hypothetical protein